MWHYFRKLPNRRIKSQITKISGGLPLTYASPDELLGELFRDVQMRRIHADGKTFVDLVPSHRLSKILREYEVQRQNPHFDLHKFVQQYFRDYLVETRPVYRTNPNNTPEEHINELWGVLKRETYLSKGSLLPLPYPYLTPGGRFSELFYWDTYFIMLGLASTNQYELIDGMMKNYAFMIRKYGYIPTANRSYLLSRSQPPFFSHMVELLAEKKGKSIYVRYLPYLLAEYSFWMRGSKELGSHRPAYRRVVLMHDGTIMNRYYDSKRTPRSESYKEDVETAALAEDRISSQVYLDIRAGAESGWDFSSRWFKDPAKISTIHTTDIVPVDLNCLLVHLEQSIAKAYKLLKQPLLAKRYQKKADVRAEAIRNYCWSSKNKFFFDYDFVADKRTPRLTLAGVFPLYCKVATQHQADVVAKTIKEKFLKRGGVLTTLEDTGQQWDAPNGWAPLHWVTIQGLRNYGHNDLAEEIKKRWIASNIKVYAHESKMVEKYNVVDSLHAAGGGEYPLQDGFGWTNGVLQTLLREDKK